MEPCGLAVLSRVTKRSIGSLVVPTSADASVVWEIHLGAAHGVSLHGEHERLGVKGTPPPAINRSWWDAVSQRQGHTGWADSLVYRYDQPLRLAAVRRVLRVFFPEGLRGVTAIDIGCGTGDFSRLLSGEGARVLAFDFSAEVLGQARRRLPIQSHIDWCCASAAAIPVRTAAAGAVTCVTVLQHLTCDGDVRSAATELRRVLDPCGRAIVIELMPMLDAATSARMAMLSSGHQKHGAKCFSRLGSR